MRYACMMLGKNINIFAAEPNPVGRDNPIAEDPVFFQNLNGGEPVPGDAFRMLGFCLGDMNLSYKIMLIG